MQWRITMQTAFVLQLATSGPKPAKSKLFGRHAPTQVHENAIPPSYGQDTEDRPVVRSAAFLTAVDDHDVQAEDTSIRTIERSEN